MEITENLLEEAKPDMVGIGGGAQRFAGHGEASNFAKIQELGALEHRVSGNVRQRFAADCRLCHVQLKDVEGSDVGVGTGLKQGTAGAGTVFNLVFIYKKKKKKWRFGLSDPHYPSIK